MSFGYDNQVVTGSTTDVVVVVYDKKKGESNRHIVRVIGHGKCVHYYS